MKKIYLLILSLLCLSTLCSYAASPCDSEVGTYPKSGCNCQKHKYTQPKTNCAKPCEKTPQYSTPCTSGFLCTRKNADTLFKCMNLSQTQICNAMKIQEKYEQEVLSLNERIQCEHSKYAQLSNNCAKGSEKRKQKRLIKNLEKKRKDICKCYEKQFEATLSDMQKKAYKKAKK